MKTIILISIYLFITGCKTDGINPQDFTPGGNEGLSEGSYRKKNKGITDLTKNYSRIPSSQEVTGYIDEALSPVIPSCFEIIETVSLKSGGVAQGARKVLATFFQSCDILSRAIDQKTPSLRGVRTEKNGSQRSRVITDQDSFVESNIFFQGILENEKYPGLNCIDARKSPPVYGYASRKVPDKSGVINLFSEGAGVSENSQEASGIDCSSFLSVALASQGLKVTEKSNNFVGITTSNLKVFLRSKTSCLENAKFSKSSSLGAGDIVNLAGNHVIIIDEVSDDPLAIKKYSKLNNCNAIKISDFDFTYIHSGSINNSYGPSRVHSSKHRGGEMFNNLRIMAVKMCKESLTSGKEINSDELSPNTSFDIIRHRGDNPSCVTTKKAKLKNEECVNSCLEEVSK